MDAHAVRVVLDTNIFVSSLLHPLRVPGQIVTAWITKRFDLISSELQIVELRTVLDYPRLRDRIARPKAGALINRIRQASVMIDRIPMIERSPDPDDDYLLALAEAGRADWLVTGDKPDLLALERHPDTRIASAAVFAAELGLES